MWCVKNTAIFSIQASTTRSTVYVQTLWHKMWRVAVHGTIKFVIFYPSFCALRMGSGLCALRMGSGLCKNTFILGIQLPPLSRARPCTNIICLLWHKMWRQTSICILNERWDFRSTNFVWWKEGSLNADYECIFTRPTLPIPYAQSDSIENIPYLMVPCTATLHILCHSVCT